MARSLNFQMDKHWVLVKAAGVFEKAVQIHATPLYPWDHFNCGVVSIMRGLEQQVLYNTQ